MRSDEERKKVAGSWRRDDYTITIEVGQDFVESLLKGYLMRTFRNFRFGKRISPLITVDMIFNPELISIQ